MRKILFKTGYVFYPKLTSPSNLGYDILGDNSHYFIGYYDHDPISLDGTKIICHRINSSFSRDVEPKCGDIGFFCLQSKKFIQLISVYALNWQLGSRVQWFDDKRIIFNDLDGDIQCSKVFNYLTKSVESVLPWPFWAISPNRKLGVSLNFEVLKKKRPGYGYLGSSPDGDKNLIRIFELNSQSIISEFLLEDVLTQLSLDSSEIEGAYFNHICWNPDSTKFITVISWESPKFKKRFIYGVLFDILNESICLLNSIPYFSHHAWISENSFIAYLEVDGKKGYYIWNDGRWESTGRNFPFVDGHPTISNDSDLVFVDTYPSKFSLSKLFYCSLKVDSYPTELLSVSSNPSFTGALRCDLHPRFSALHSKIVCDLPSYTTRKILVIDL